MRIVRAIMVAFLTLIAITLPLGAGVLELERAPAHEPAVRIAADAAPGSGEHVCARAIADCEGGSSRVPACPSAPAAACALGAALPVRAAAIAPPVGETDAVPAAAHLFVAIPQVRSIFRPPRA